MAGRVRLGLVTPVLTLNPRAHNRWEEDAGLAEVSAVAEAADRLGYAHLTCSEHVAVPVGAAATRGGRYWDPLATFGYLAARTTTIRFATHVLVLGYHHPLEIAKRYGTLDRVTGGRLTLGVGVGSLQEEFELLGREFDARGPRADDALRALRACLSKPEHDGFVVDPCAVQERVPVWVGGRTLRSLRRAVALADGWAPFGLGPDELAAMLTRVPPPAGDFELVLHPHHDLLDPSAEPDRTVDAVGRLVEVGATVVNLRLASRSLAHHLEQLEAMRALV